MTVKTIYLVPHAHTDIGYTHDPVVVWELHDRFLDQAINLCNLHARRRRHPIDGSEFTHHESRR